MPRSTLVILYLKSKQQRYSACTDKLEVRSTGTTVAKKDLGKSADL
jgi:hypothetical protein